MLGRAQAGQRGHGEASEAVGNCGHLRRGLRKTRSPTRCIRRAQPEEQMKQSVLVGLSVLAFVGCTPQPSPQIGAGTQPMMPAAAYAAGSPSNTTSAFDGTYTGGTIQNIGKGKQLD